MKATNAGHAFGITFVDELVRAGIRYACLSPGSRSTPLALAFAQHPAIDLLVAHDERSCGFIALGIARSTGRAAPVLTTSGTAAANLHPAVVEADLARVPLLVLTADRPPELRATGANQAIDQIKLFGDSVRWFCEVGTPEALEASGRYWRSLAARSIYVAEGSPAGPVHLNVALREPLVPTAETFPYPLDGRDAGGPWTGSVRGERAPSAADIERLAERIGGIERGIVVAGPGPYEGAAPSEIADALGWPLLADPLSNGRRGEHAISTYDALLRIESFAGDHRPDAVLRFGSLGISKALMSHIRDAPLQILVDPDGAFLDPDRSVHQVVHADVAPTVTALVRALSGPTERSAWLGSWTSADRIARAALDEVLDADETPREPRVARDLVASLPDGSALFVAASMPLRDVEWFTLPRPEVRFFANRGANGIDGSIATPVGIALALDAPTFALVGDVAFLHDQNGLLSSVTSEIDLTIVVVNNDGGGIFSFLPQADDPEHFERLFGTPHGRDLATVARLHGCEHNLVERASDLAEALQRREPGTRIVEVRTQRSENVSVHTELNEAVVRAIRP